MSIEGQRARNGRGSPASDRPQRWGALVTGVCTQRFARMWYVVTGLVPARIEVRPSNGLGALYTLTLDSEMHELATSKHLNRLCIATSCQAHGEEGHLDEPLNI
jgi:hypothetical protein